MVRNIKEKILDPTEENLKVAATCVKEGGIIVLPSDCNLGLTVNPWKEDAVNKAFIIKNRPSTSPLTLFFFNPEDWVKYGETDKTDIVNALVKEFWPGPLNIILKKKSNVPNKMLCNGETVSLCCAANPVWREFMKYIDIPVAMTSANLSGQADGILVDLNLAVKQVGDKVDYLVRGGAQGTTKSSTIIDLSATPKVVRHGDITVDELNRVVNIFEYSQGL